MPTQEKIQEVAALAESFKSSSCLAVTDYQGLTVEKMTNLRRELRNRKIRYIVARNTLLRLAAREAGLSGLDDYLRGPSAVAFGYEDAGPLAKVLFDFGKEHHKPQIRALVVDGAVYGGPEAERIAKLPSKPELQAQLIGYLLVPLREFVGTLDGVIRELVGTLEAMKEKTDKQP